MLPGSTGYEHAQLVSLQAAMDVNWHDVRNSATSLSLVVPFIRGIKPWNLREQKNVPSSSERTN